MHQPLHFQKCVIFVHPERWVALTAVPGSVLIYCRGHFYAGMGE